MKLCDETITVFNAYNDYDEGEIKYAPTVITGVSWFCEIASNVTDEGLKAANKFTIRVPEDADFTGKSYVTPAEYDAAETRDGVFTFKQGDTIVHVAETEALTPSQLQEKYGEIVTVLGVTDNRRTPNARHWKIIGN